MSGAIAGPRRVMAATVRMRVRPEKREEFIQAMGDLTTRTRRAPGCVGAHFYADSEDPNAFTLVEEWRRRRDLDRHLRSDEFAAVIGASFLLSHAAEIALDLVSHQGGTDEVLRRRLEAAPARRPRGSKRPRPGRRDA
jgi:quinol monooxygenase YgiN